MIEISKYIIKDRDCYTLRWSDNCNFITVSNDYETLTLSEESIFKLIDAWFKSHFKENK